MPGIFAALQQLDEGRHRAELYRMWGAGLSAGFTHPKSLDRMGPRGSPDSEEARQWLIRGTERGQDLATVVRAGGERFEEIERALLTLGEETGRLEEALRLLGDFYTRKHRLMLWVKKQMAYPLFTAFAACFIAPFPLLFFGNSRAYAAAVLSGVALLVLASGGVIAAVAARYGKKPPLARARMARALATAVQAGLTLPRAVRLAADASGSPEIRAWVGRMSEHRLATSSVEDSLAGCPGSTPELLAVLATAERTGDFTGLTRLADLYEEGFR